MKSAFFLLLVLSFATVVAADTPRLPLVEIPATRGASDTFVIFISGDGGWAAIDRAISRQLAAEGMPVAGLNALQYFWTRRTPAMASRDLATIMSRYVGAWHKARVILVGYSRGADVLPAMINGLPPDLKARIRMVALLGPSHTVEFEFHVADWMRAGSKGHPVKPEIEKLTAPRILCLSGEDDTDSVCRDLSGHPRVHVVMLKGSHHFDGEYEKLGRLIIEHIP